MTVGRQLLDPHTGQGSVPARRRERGPAEVLLDPADLVTQAGSGGKHGDRGEQHDDEYDPPPRQPVHGLPQLAGEEQEERDEEQRGQRPAQQVHAVAQVEDRVADRPTQQCAETVGGGQKCGDERGGEEDHETQQPDHVAARRCDGSVDGELQQRYGDGHRGVRGEERDGGSARETGKPPDENGTCAPRGQRHHGDATEEDPPVRARGSERDEPGQAGQRHEGQRRQHAGEHVIDEAVSLDHRGCTPPDKPAFSSAYHRLRHRERHD
ncbi:hypothetical protein [Streptomyces capitiformicae]|uniref:Uncharacterized protein n=1 Tax=Streptomyces capitiformicae TaxID=2014920 RepID=A0A919DPN1_9ACTN|nr:hypothetical protein [Streptomyces capitiformicae]GHE66947.1 hypothetical protein GCM10017771_90610 [Streptomyces capitiformicae]